MFDFKFFYLNICDFEKLKLKETCLPYYTHAEGFKN